MGNTSFWSFTETQVFDGDTWECANWAAANGHEADYARPLGPPLEPAMKCRPGVKSGVVDCSRAFGTGTCAYISTHESNARSCVWWSDGVAVGDAATCANETIRAASCEKTDDAGREVLVRSIPPTVHWTEPPKNIFGMGSWINSTAAWGVLPDGPILGNGDLGVSLGAEPELGSLVLNIGLNQMIAIVDYDLTGDWEDQVFPRRVALGAVVLSSDAVIGGKFTASQELANGEVTASLSASAAQLNVTVVLSPDRNEVIVRVQANRLPQLKVMTTVVPLPKQLCRRTPGGGGAPVTNCHALDGTVKAGAADGTVWAQRQPLGISSPQPVSAAIAASIASSGHRSKAHTDIDEGTRLSDHAAVVTATFTEPAVAGALSLTVNAAIVTNLDLCRRLRAAQTAAGCTDPMPTAVLRSVHLKDESNVTAVEEASASFWDTLWGSSSVSIPGEPWLERLYFGQTYLIASATRAGKAPPGLYGPWVHVDSPYCEGDLTINYNFEATYWSLYSTNRIELTWAQYDPFIDFMPKARKSSDFFGCPGALRFPDHIFPWGHQGIRGGDPYGATAHSNGLLSALNFIQHFEYTANATFLRDLAFPYARDTMAFYLCWMTRRRDGVWENNKDCSHECIPYDRPADAAGYMAAASKYCWQNNSVLANGLIRRVTSALPAMAKAAGEVIDPRWKDIVDHSLPLPTAHTGASGDEPNREVFVLAGAYAASKNVSNVSVSWCYANCPDCNCGVNGCHQCHALPKASQNVNLWAVWPSEAVSLASSDRLQQIARDTLRAQAPWTQLNSFCSVFSQAARVGLPLEEWLPQMRQVVAGGTQPNLVYTVPSVGMEAVGALQAVADLMLQSTEPYIAVFPLNMTTSTLSFNRLRAKGGFVVSAARSNVTERISGLEVHSEAGKTCSLRLPFAVGDVSVRQQRAATKPPIAVERHATDAHRFQFETEPDVTYDITLGHPKAMKTDDSQQAEPSIIIRPRAHQAPCGNNQWRADQICASFCSGQCSFYNASVEPPPAPQNLTLYRVTPRNVTDISNKDTGDPRGDIGFYLSRKSLVKECRGNPHDRRCFLAGDNIFAQFVIEFDGAYGGYHMCNPMLYSWGSDTAHFECSQDCLTPPNCSPQHHNGSGWHGGVQCFCVSTLVVSLFSFTTLSVFAILSHISTHGCLI
jgi:hypothetical protein